MANFDLTQPITVNGTIFEPSDLTQTMLLVHGVQPTNYDKWKRINILVQHKNVKVTAEGERAGGNAQAVYLYDELADLNRFHEYRYPYYLPCVITKVTNMKGELEDLVLFVDFASIQELELVPRQKTKPTPQATPAPATAKA